MSKNGTKRVRCEGSGLSAADNPPWGTCPDCGQVVYTTVAGNLRVHNRDRYTDSKYLGANETARDMIAELIEDVEDAAAQLEVAGFLTPPVEREVRKAIAAMQAAQRWITNPNTGR